MKKIILPLSGLALLCFFFSQCIKDQCSSTQSYVRFDPIYKTEAACRQDLKSEASRDLHKPGKIYAIGSYLLINEFQEGIHVLDNSDPAHPNKLAFWNIPGNVDMAVRGNLLFVDQYMDLLTFDISNIFQPQLICRKERAFTMFGFDANLGYIIDYNQANIKEEVPCNSASNGGWVRRDNSILMNIESFDKQFDSNGLSGGAAIAAAGISGSYARFALAADYLYTVDNTTLRSWKLSSSCPESTNEQSIGWGIETIFPWKDRLFIGSQNGVFIYNNNNPSLPVYENAFIHATGCDPVVCDENYAFVTVHGGTRCNGSTVNQMDIIDIRNMPNISSVATYPMKEPKGLGLAGKYLYLCDDGLKIFDRSVVTDLKELAHVKIQATDVIALSTELIMVVGADGFYQYDVSNPSKPKQIGLIPVVK